MSITPRTSVLYLATILLLERPPVKMKLFTALIAQKDLKSMNKESVLVQKLFTLHHFEGHSLSHLALE